MKPLVILGAGGFGREVAWLIGDINEVHPEWDVIGFLDRDASLLGYQINGIPVISPSILSQLLPNLYAVVAIRNTRFKLRAVEEATILGCKFATLIHPDVTYDKSTVTFGAGTIVCSGNKFTVNITVGNHVIVNLNSTIGHDCAIGDYVTISPGCHLSGHTRIREGVYMGTGSVTVENHVIRSWSTVGAGAVVARDVPANVTVVGVPAKRWLKSA